MKNRFLGKYKIVQNTLWRQTCLFFFLFFASPSERKTWTTPSEYLKWESARYPSLLDVSIALETIFVLWLTRLFPLGVSFQFHAEVYFDQEQQSYMLVDQGSQNGTVINGNRILQVPPLNPSVPLVCGGKTR